MNTKLKLSAPWVIYYRQLLALFGEDPEIKIVYDEDSNTIKLFVDNAGKADALAKLLPEEKQYGNVTVNIKVVPANSGEVNLAVLYQRAFSGNPIFSYNKTVDGIFSNPISYFVFKKRVVQYFNDDLGDINGLCSTLYQDIADDVFDKKDGICFCTDTEDLVGKPLGEWP